MTKANENLTLLPCNNCERRNVQPRRPSSTGVHWCSAPACKSAKASYYAARRKRVKLEQAQATEKGKELAKDQIRLAFVRAMMARVPCPGCGLVDALPGFAHRDQQGQPCDALGRNGRGVIDISWLDAAMPAPRTYNNQED